jgi:hypothetical protein
MRALLNSKKFKIYTIIISLYTAITYFLTDYSCMRTGGHDMCGLGSLIYNLPAVVLTFPLQFLFNSGSNNTNMLTHEIYAVAYYFFMVLGWLIFGAIVRFVFLKLRSFKSL